MTSGVFVHCRGLYVAVALLPTGPSLVVLDKSLDSLEASGLACLGGAAHALDLTGDAASVRRELGEGNHDQRSEFAADDDNDGEYGKAADIVTGALAKETGCTRVDGCVGSGDAWGRGQGRRREDASVREDGLDAGLVELRVGLSKLEQMLEKCSIGIASGEVEEGWPGGGGWVDSIDEVRRRRCRLHLSSSLALGMWQLFVLCDI